MSEPVRASAHRAPDGVSDTTVEGVGKLSEAFEYVERARGHLYSFHQLTGEADFKIGDAVDQLREAGHVELAERLQREIVGRNVIGGRWTFQIMEEYDDTYWSAVRDAEREVREALVGGRRHLADSLPARARTHATHWDEKHFHLRVHDHVHPVALDHQIISAARILWPSL